MPTFWENSKRKRTPDASRSREEAGGPTKKEDILIQIGSPSNKVFEEDMIWRYGNGAEPKSKGLAYGSVIWTA